MIPADRLRRHLLSGGARATPASNVKIPACRAEALRRRASLLRARAASPPCPRCSIIPSHTAPSPGVPKPCLPRLAPRRSIELERCFRRRPVLQRCKRRCCGWGIAARTLHRAACGRHGAHQIVGSKLVRPAAVSRLQSHCQKIDAHAGVRIPVTFGPRERQARCEAIISAFDAEHFSAPGTPSSGELIHERDERQVRRISEERISRIPTRDVAKRFRARTRRATCATDSRASASATAPSSAVRSDRRRGSHVAAGAADRPAFFAADAAMYVSCRSVVKPPGRILARCNPSSVINRQSSVWLSSIRSRRFGVLIEFEWFASREDRPPTPPRASMTVTAAPFS